MTWTEQKRDPITLRLEELKKREQQCVGNENSALGRAIAPATQKVGAHIPDGLHDLLGQAFCKAFSLLFSQGNDLILRSYDQAKLHRRFAALDAGFGERGTLRSLHRFSKNAGQGRLATQLFSGVSGTGMGILGVGLPDIPIIIATLLRTVYQTAERCGYGVDGIGERLFVLRLIRNAVQTGERQRRHHQQLLALGESLDQATRFTGSLEEETRRTADALADAVLVAKFVQGLPLVGAVGGVANFVLVGQVSEYAALVYETRYLLKKRAMQHPSIPKEGGVSGENL